MGYLEKPIFFVNFPHTTVTVNFCRRLSAIFTNIRNNDYKIFSVKIADENIIFSVLTMHFKTFLFILKQKKNRN